MKIEAIKDIIIYIEGKSFIFSYEELANVYINIEDEKLSIKVKPNEEPIL